MSKTPYSKELCSRLFNAANDPVLKIGHRRSRYETGDSLHYHITGLHPAVEAEAVLVVERFLGGGFAGQVYCCRLIRLELSEGRQLEELTEGSLYAVKIIRPASAFALWFRNTIYRIAFQGPFSAQVNRAACRSGLLMQKLIRRTAAIRFGRETAVKDAYASFYDPAMRSYGEITEWIEGRMWLLESDSEMAGRRKWKSIPLEQTKSPEYIAKRRFMADMVRLMHDMGAPEFARQYEWWTMKSQPNSMKRTDLPDCDGPGDGLCAIDFRAGLALLPFLPMSPADVRLIFTGLFRRGALVQFDRCDTAKLRAFLDTHAESFADLKPLIDEFLEQNAAYRRSLPDLTKQGLALLRDPALRQDTRNGLIEGYLAEDLIDPDFARTLAKGGFRFIIFYLIGALPLFGQLIRKRWGNRAYREHIAGILFQPAYRKVALQAHAASRLIDWHRAGRIDEQHAELLYSHPLLFLVEHLLLGFLPIALHRVILRPRRIPDRILAGWLFLKNFIISEAFREKWFLAELAQGEADGMLTADERAHLESIVTDPFIVRYLKCLGVHFATLPVTQLVSVLTASLWSAWLLLQGHSWGDAAGAFFITLAIFQILPVSPGSFCRGGFVVFLMIRERNLRDYVIAAPVSFLKYIGYLAFPLQMTTNYPRLSRFMASRWATNMVHLIPVFGEKGALLEHWMFDTFFNRPQQFGRWAAPRMRTLLALWMLSGLALFATIVAVWSPDLTRPKGFNLLLGTIVVFILPRVCFYPLIRRNQRRASF